MDRQRPQRRDLKPGFKLWLSTGEGEGAFGEGKWRLLEAILRRGSLRAAADELGISYRKAWGDLKKAERCTGVTFLERCRGGAGGGETHLTDEGRRWIAEYRRFHSAVEKAVGNAFSDWRARILDRSR